MYCAEDDVCQGQIDRGIEGMEMEIAGDTCLRCGSC